MHHRWKTMLVSAMIGATELFFSSSVSAACSANVVCTIPQRFGIPTGENHATTSVSSETQPGTDRSWYFGIYFHFIGGKGQAGSVAKL